GWALLKVLDRSSARHMSWNQLPQPLRLSAIVQQTLSQKIDELTKLLMRQDHRRLHQWIKACEHRLNRTDRTLQIGFDIGSRRVIIAGPGCDIEVETDGVLKRCESTVVEERRL